MYQDFSDLLRGFDRFGVEYLLVGAHALAAHGHVRATKDMDVWIRAEPANAARALRALAAYGAPVENVTVDDLTKPGTVYQIGVPPIRIDVLTSIEGLEFDEAWSERLIATLEGMSVPVLSRRHLIRNKRAAGRLQDLADVEKLEAMERTKDRR